MSWWEPIVLYGAIIIAGLCLLEVGVAVWMWWRRRDLSGEPVSAWPMRTSAKPGRNGESKPLVSLVLLLRQPRELEEAELRQHVERAWGIELSDADDAANFVVGVSPSFVVKIQDRCFLVNAFPTPYFQDSRRAAERVQDKHLRGAIIDHAAWLSVDLLGQDEADLPEAYRWIGRLAAELADEQCLAVVSTELERISLWAPELRSRLSGRNPLAVFQDTSGAEEARMKQASAEARRRWGEFVSAFENRTDEQQFSVRALVSKGGQSEMVWLRVTALENGMIYGRLAGDPVTMTGLGEGNRVRLREADLNDWLYTRGPHLCGGFTIEATRRAQE